MPFEPISPGHLTERLLALAEPLRRAGSVDPRFEDARAELLRLDDRKIVDAIAGELEASFAAWAESSAPLAAIRFHFAGQELAPWVATEAMASGYGSVEREGDRPRFRQRLFDSRGGFSLLEITGPLADLGDDDELADHADFEHLRALAMAFARSAAARGVQRAIERPGFARVPRAGALLFFVAAHDETPMPIWRAD
jgi:hypothetical protein